MKEYIEKTEAVERALYTPIMSSGAVREKDRDAWTDGAIDAQEQIAKSIGEIPAADVVERKRGEWIKVGESCGVDLLECPVCHTIHAQDGDAFCRDCGADMRSHHDSLCDQTEEGEA